MPISATGRRSSPAEFSQTGFSLVEVLVVLVIVAVLAGILLFSYGRSHRDLLEGEASRLATVLNLALEEAVVRSSDMGVVFDATSYRFVVFEPRERRWRPVARQPLAAHQLRPGMTLALELPEESMTGETRRLVNALRNRETALRPQLLLFPSGEMTPFEVTLTLEDATARALGDGVSPVQWSAEP